MTTIPNIDEHSGLATKPIGHKCNGMMCKADCDQAISESRIDLIDIYGMIIIGICKLIRLFS